MDPKLRGGVAERSESDAGTSAGETTISLDPWKAYAGIWRDNPDFEAFLQQIAHMRSETDEAQIEES